MARYIPNNYYDVCYKTPMGRYGMHYAVGADSVEHAAKVSLFELSVNTPWKSEEFTVISINPSESAPSKEAIRDYK